MNGEPVGARPPREWAAANGLRVDGPQKSVQGPAYAIWRFLTLFSFLLVDFSSFQPPPFEEEALSSASRKGCLNWVDSSPGQRGWVKVPHGEQICAV